MTKPSPQMRQAMAAAEVGDSQYGEDPTVAQLERETARTLGKEAALFVPSGTMGNLISVLAQCQRGDEAIVGDNAHVFYYEAAGSSAFGGVSFHIIPDHNGLLDPEEVRRAIRERGDEHYPKTALLCIENTHNRGGGRCVSVSHTKILADVAHEHDVSVHLDGSRLFNAAVALGETPAALAAPADTVNICFSKGLGAPVGSAVAGSAQFIERAVKLRKMAGGGMRQAGILAAAALIALREGPKRLHEDHKNARTLAQGLKDSGKFIVDLDQVETNMVVFTTKKPDERDRQPAAWANNGVLISELGEGWFRAVTHLDISEEQAGEAARRLAARVAG